MPPSFFADELPHIIRADSLLHGDTIGFRGNAIGPSGDSHVIAGVHADLGLLGIGLTVPPMDMLAAAKIRA
ncbi:MAG TPA: hypothetical protein VND19_22345 [Acetobacteraceae bacterium]|nr:hypothetical protein [Acetobacteraceae bacterium]